MTDIAELDEGDQLTHEFFLLDSASVRETKSGDPYVAGTLRDQSGRIDLRVWGSDTHPDPGVVVSVEGYVDSYNGDLQIVAQSVTDADDRPTRDYVASSHRPPEYLLEEVLQIAEEQCDPALYAVIGFVLDVGVDPEPDGILTLVDAPNDLFGAPAAKSNHHARLGGLIEHIHAVANHVVAIARWYTWSRPADGPAPYDCQLDIGVLVAGAILHDIGKLAELSGAVGTEYTADGELEGHISIAIRWFDEAAEQVGLDDETRRHVRHLILSHHGRREWGSPVEPRTAEANLLHQIDMLDSRMDPALSALEGADDEGRVETPRGEELLVPGGGS